LFEGPVLSLAFDSSGNHLLVGTSGYKAHLIDLRAELVVEATFGHRAEVTSVGCSANGTLITGSFQSLRFWDPPDQWQSYTLVHKSPVKAVAFNAAGSLCAVATNTRSPAIRDEQGTVWFWSSATGNPHGEPLMLTEPVSALAFHPHDDILLIAAGEARMVDLATGRRVGVRLDHGQPVRAACFSQDGTLALTGSDDGTVRLWEVPSGRPVGSALEHPDSRGISALAISPDGETVLAGGRDGQAWRWRWRNAERLDPPLKHRGPIQSVAFSPDGCTIVTGSEDRTAQVWSATTGERAAPSFEHDATVLALCFAAEGRTIITAGEDGSVRFWDLASRSMIHHRKAHQGAVRDVRYHEATRKVLTGGDDGIASLWSIPRTTAPIDPDRIVLWAQVQTQMELDENGESRQLDPDVWQSRKEQLARSAADVVLPTAPAHNP
jgi:WD40 repeat protein